MAKPQKTIPDRNAARAAAMLKGPRSMAGVAADLLMAQAGFEVTGNPLFAWRALWSCLASRVTLPSWLRDYFVDVAGKMKGLSIKDTFPEEKKIDRAIQALGLGNQGHVFNRFDDAQAGLRLTTLVLVSKNAGKPGAIFTYKGKPINQKRLVAQAKATNTVSPWKVEEQMALANKIRDRYGELVKVRSVRIRKKRT